MYFSNSVPSAAESESWVLIPKPWDQNRAVLANREAREKTDSPRTTVRVVCGGSSAFLTQQKIMQHGLKLQPKQNPSQISVLWSPRLIVL